MTNTQKSSLKLLIIVAFFSLSLAVALVTSQSQTRQIGRAAPTPLPNFTNAASTFPVFPEAVTTDVADAAPSNTHLSLFWTVGQEQSLPTLTQWYLTALSTHGWSLVTAPSTPNDLYGQTLVAKNADVVATLSLSREDPTEPIIINLELTPAEVLTETAPTVRVYNGGHTDHDTY